MRSLLIRTFTLSAVLSVLTVAASVILFTRKLTASESEEFGATAGYAGKAFGTQLSDGVQSLIHLISEPAFSAPIILPQLALIFVFIWTGTIISALWNRR